MSEDFSVRRLDSIEAAISARNFVIEAKLPLRSEADFLVMASRMGVLKSLLLSKQRSNFRKIETGITNGLVEMSKSLRGNSYIRTRDRLRLILVRIPGAYGLMCRIQSLARSLVK